MGLHADFKYKLKLSAENIFFKVKNYFRIVFLKNLLFLLFAILLVSFPPIRQYSQKQEPILDTIKKQPSCWAEAGTPTKQSTQ